MKQQEEARLWPCPQLFLCVLSFTLSFIRRLPILHPFNWLQMPTGLPLMGMFRVGQQVLCWSCCKVLMKALDGCPNLPWGSAPLPGRKPWESSQETQHVLITGASWKGWVTSHMQSSPCHVVEVSFFPVETVNSCLPHSLPPTLNSVVTTLGTNEGPALITPGTDVTPIFHKFPPFPVLVFYSLPLPHSFVQWLFNLCLFLKWKPPEVLLGMRRMLSKLGKC